MDHVNRPETRRAYLETFPPKISKGDKTKLDIVEATIRMVASEGLAATCFESLARRMKLSRPHLTYHFRSFDELLEAALRFVSNVNQERAISLLEGEQNPRKRLQLMIRASFAWARERPDHLRFRVSCMDAFSHSRRFKAIHTEIVEMSYTWFETSLSEIPGVSPKLAREGGMTIHSLLQGQLVTYVTTTGAEIGALERQTLFFVENLLKLAP